MPHVLEIFVCLQRRFSHVLSKGPRRVWERHGLSEI